MPCLRRIWTFGLLSAAFISTALHASIGGAQTSAWITNSSGNLGTGTNWDSAPTAGDATALSFSFNVPASAIVLTNDLADPFILNSLVIASNTNQGISFAGGTFQFNGVNAVMANNSTMTTPVTIGSNIVIGANGLSMITSTVGTTQANASQFIINGNVTASSSGAVTLTLSGSSISNTNRIIGVISDGVLGGTLGIFKTGSGTWTITNSANTFSGGVTIDQGTLRYLSVDALGTGGPITLGTMSNTSGTLSYFGATPTTLTRNIGLGGTAVQSIAAEATTGVLTVSNSLSFIDGAAKTLALSGAGAGANDFQSLLTDNAGSPLSLQKTGAGVWVVSNTGNDFTGGTTIFAGNLRVTDLNTQILAGGVLRFGAAAATVGVLESSGTITNNLGTGAGQIAFGTGVAAQNSGGFSAVGGNLDVTLNNDAVTSIAWSGGQLGTNLSNTTELQLNSTLAEGVVTIHNSFTLGSGSHRIRATDNILSAADMSVLSGTISGAGGITSTGNGILVLSGNNAYTGGTSIAAGILRVTDAAANLNLKAGGGPLRFTGTGTATAGVLETSGTLTNALGTGAGEISWVLSGGFSAYGGALDVTLSGNETSTLVWGTAPFITTTQSLVLSSTAADDVVTLHNAIDLGGLTRTVRVFDNTAVATDYAVLSGSLSNGGLLKIGTGLLVLSGTNTFGGGITIGGGGIGGGVLRGDAVTNLNIVGASGNNVSFDGAPAAGAVLETSGSLTNDIGAGAGQIRWSSAGTTTQGSGGFSAFGAPLSVTLNNNNTTPLVWGGTTNFVVTNAELQFGSIYSDDVVTFHNPIDLNNAVRTIRVFDNPDSPDDMTVLTGTISSATPASGGLIKQGSGTLVLTADATYSGLSSVRDGTLQLGNGGNGGMLMGNIRLTTALNPNSTALIFNHSSIVNYAGVISGNGGNVLITGPTTGGVQFNGANTYTTATTLDAGTLRFGIANALAAGSTLAVNSTGTLDLNDFSTTVAQLGAGDGGAGVITNGGTGLATLTVSSTTLDSTFNGLIRDGTGTVQINKAGAGTTLTLGGTNTYSGGTTLVAGNLFIAGDSSLGSGTLRLAGGLFDAGAGNRNLNLPVQFAGTATVTGGGNLAFSAVGSAVSATSFITLNNTGTVSINGLSLSGLATFDGTSVLTVTGDSGVIAAATLTNNGNLLTFNNLVLSNNLTLSGTGAFNVVGVLSSSGANTTLTAGAQGGVTLNDIAITTTGDDTARILTLASLTSGTLTINGTISDGGQAGGGLVVGGAVSNVVINGSNSFTGGVSLVAGTLIMGNADALSTGPITAVAGILDPGTAPRTLANDVILLGTLSLTGNQLLTLNGTVTTSGSNRIIAANNTAGTVINGAVHLAETTFTAAVGRITTISGAGPVTINGVIDNGGLATSGTVSISNTGGVVFTADNTFSGRVTIGAGAQLTVGAGGTTGNIPQLVSVNTGNLIFNRSDVFTYSGVISGGGNVIINGPSTGGVQFDGANTYSGFTTVQSGLVRYGTNIALGASSKLAVNTSTTVDLNGFSGTVAQLLEGDGGGGRIINNGTTLSTLTISSTTLDSTFAGVIEDGTGTLAIHKAGAGTTLTLFGNNAYSGGTRLVAGNLVVNGEAAVGTGTLTLAGGVFDTLAGNRSFNLPLALSGSPTLTGDGNIAFTAAGNTAAAAAVVTFNHTGTTLINGLATSGALTFAGTSPVTVTGDSVALAALSITNNTPTTLTLNNLYFDVAQTVVLAGAQPIVFDGVLSSAGTTSVVLNGATAARAVFAGDNTYTGRVSVQAGAALTVGKGGTTGNLPAVTTNAGSVTFNRSSVLTYSGVISGVGSVIVDGAATGGVQFNTAQTFTGLTTIDQGTLVYGIANALPITATVAVNTTGTLDIGGFAGTVATLSDGADGGGFLANSGASAALTINQGAFSGALVGANLSINKATAGTLLLSGASTFAGASTLTLGTLEVADDQALGGAVWGLVAGTLQFDGERTVANDFLLGGTAITLSGNSNLTLNGDFLNNAGNRGFAINNTGVTTINGDVILSEGATGRILTLTLGDQSDVVINGAIRNAVSVVSNTGTLSVTGANGSLRLTSTSDPRLLSINGVGNTVTLADTGALQLTNASPIITITGTSNVLTLSGSVGASALAMSGTNSAVNVHQLMGNGTVTMSGEGAHLSIYGTMGNGAILLTGTNSQFDVYGITGSGAVSLTGVGAQYVVHTGGAIGNGAIVLNNDTLFELQAGATAGTGAITTFGSATVILNGTKGVGNITLDSGAVLIGSGSSAGTLTTAVGSNVYVGGEQSVGTLTLGRIVLNGGTLRFDLGSTSDLLFSAALPLITSTATINVAAASGFGVGDYTLISGYTGTFLNTNLFNVIAPVGYQKELESIAGSLILHLTAAVSKSWSGTVDNVWDNGVTANFNGQTYDDVNRDAVSFLDGAANTSITISTGGLGVAPTSVLVNNSATTYTFDGDPITGDGQLSKQGNGLLVILNNNTFTGGVQISAGSVQLGNGGATGQFNQTSNISLNNDAQLLVNRSDVLTLTGNIAGTGAVVMNGSGTLQLAGFNTYFGGSIVNSGSFEVVGAGVLNEFGGWTVNGGAMSLLSSTNQITQTITVNGGVLNVNLSAGAVTATVANLNGGTVNLLAGTTTIPLLNVDGGTVNLDGGSLVPSVLFNLMSGTVNLVSTNLTLSVSQFGGGLGDAAVLNIGSGLTLTVNNTLTYTAANNAATDPDGALITGAGAVDFGAAARSVVVNDSANAAYDLTIDAPISGGMFLKSGAGALYLKGVNSSTGVNGLSGGTLVIGNDSALGTGQLTVTTGTISGDGTARTISNVIVFRGATTIGGASELTFNHLEPINSQTLTIDNSGVTTITELLTASNNTSSILTIRGSGTVDFYSVLAGAGTGNDSFNLDGQGVYNLRGVSTYTGITSVRDGTAVVYNPGAFGVSSQVYVGVANVGGRAPRLLLDGGLTLTNNVFVSTSGTGNNTMLLGGATAASSTFAGNITFSQGVTLSAVTGGTVNFTGVLDDFGAIVAGVTVTGGGTVVMSGANAYTGTTIVSQGLLQAGSASALGAGTQLQVNAGATFDLNGFGATVVTLTDGSDGGGDITNGGAAAALTVGGGLFTGTLGGGANLSLVKNTSGTLTLAGTNTYSGATSVAAGSLIVTGALGNSAVTVASGALLAGSGSVAGSVDLLDGGILAGTLTVAGTVTSSGIINPGDSTGTLTLGQLVLQGGAVNFELDTVGNSDRIVVTGGAAPIVGAATTLNLTALANFDEGTYGLITGYTGNTIDGGSFGNLSAPSTLSGLNLTLTTVDGALNLIVAARQLVWSGTASNAWNATDVNWSGDATVFTNTSTVIFDNSSASNGIVVDAAGVGPHNVLVNNDGAHTYTFSGGAISGKRLIKGDVGVLRLENDNAYSSGVTINAGELIVGNGSTSGSLVGNVVNNALLSFDRSDSYTFAGNISGTGALQQIGTGTLVLTGDNSFTGPTTINAGYFSVQGNYASTIYNNTGVQSTVASNTTGTIALTAPIVGNVQFEQNGSGVTTLSGASTYTGSTVVNAGTLVVGDSLNGTASVAVNAGGTFNVATGGTVTTTAGGAITVVGTANVSNSTNNAAVFVANGTINAPVVIQQGGLLKGAGTISGPVVVQTGAGLAPGNSVDSQIMSGGITLSQGSSLYFDFRDADGTTDFNGGDPGGTGAGYGWDLIDLQTGILSLGDATAVNTIDLYINAYKLDNSGHATLSNELVFDPQSSYEWLFLKVDNLSQLTAQGDDDFSRRFNVIDNLPGEAELGGVFDTASDNPFERPMSSLGVGTFSVAWTSGSQGLGLYIRYSAIPEPGSMILAGLASLGAGWYGRRRRQRARTAEGDAVAEG